MSINASDRTLGLLNTWQVLRKLNWEVELMKAMPDKVRLGVAPESAMHVTDAKLYAAINAASTSIALVDWLYHSAQEDVTVKDRLANFLEVDGKRGQVLRFPHISSCQINHLRRNRLEESARMAQSSR
ncbi:hypothetical protein [Xanthomonas campestris]|uniref:hypothetical protein n=1 Tax=Xanthomonas campestris TaxID=339 RepID=UPI002B23567B|nr:hypothetical protein [Xanthomonas campestris]MEA9732153.1 hypothetical protein [Xanthomonas campestris]